MAFKAHSRLLLVDNLQPQSRTAPGRLEAGETGEAEADQELNLRKKLMKSEQEDVAGNYFKPVRSNRSEDV